jgi:hypothetical protein
MQGLLVMKRLKGTLNAFDLGFFNLAASGNFGALI